MELKQYLQINALFSVLSGLIMIFRHDDLDNYFCVKLQYIFPIIGLNLVVFGLFVAYVAKYHLTKRLLINIISGLDAMWVLGSFLIIVLQLFDLTNQGYIAIAIVALWIAFLGYNQFVKNVDI